MCCDHNFVFSIWSSDSRRIINLSPVMVIPEEQPAQPALPIQPEGMRVVCGHCGNTFLVRKTHQDNQLNQSQACSCSVMLLCCWYMHVSNLEGQIAVYSFMFFLM